MTSQQVRLVQLTWNTVAPSGERFAAAFYERLFARAPSLRSLFSRDLTEQGRRLMHMLDICIRELRRLDSLRVAVQALGRRHGNYQVQDAHYETFGAALLDALQQFLGDAFTADVRQAWSEIYFVLSTAMKESAAQSPLSATYVSRIAS
jgi:hemoglobin-like flavoprotein